MNGIHISRVLYLRHILDVVGGCCENWEWAIQMPNDVFRHDAAVDPDDPRYALHLLHEFSTPGCAWFKPGLIPNYMKFIAHDKCSYFLGFETDAADLCARLNGNIFPRPEVFEAIQEFPSCYLLFVDDRWWEGYSSVPLINAKLRMKLDGHKTTSDRWSGDGMGDFPASGDDWPR